LKKYHSSFLLNLIHLQFPEFPLLFSAPSWVSRRNVSRSCSKRISNRPIKPSSNLSDTTLNLFFFFFFLHFSFPFTHRSSISSSTAFLFFFTCNKTQRFGHTLKFFICFKSFFRFQPMNEPRSISFFPPLFLSSTQLPVL
jgi:hypothetical protein